MDAWQTFKRRRTLRKIQTAAGVKAARGGRRSGGRLVLSHEENAAAHQLMAEDAQPNLRVWQMWDESCHFEDELSRFRDNLGKFETATDEFLTRLEPILRAPLPRVWDAVEGGLAEPTRATISHGHSHTVGGDASIAGMEEARSEYHNRLRGHVARPLHQWSEALRVVEERLPELQRLRQEVVKSSRAAARHSKHFRQRVGSGPESAVAEGPGGGAVVPYRGGGGIGSIFGACARPRVGPAGGRSSRGRRHRDTDEYDDDYTSSSSDDEGYGPESGLDRERRREVAAEEEGIRLNYKYRKLHAARADYHEAEKLIADQLSGLQRDAAWTKSYVVSALLLTKETMQISVVSLGNTKQPLPGFTGRSTLTTERHGQLTDNLRLAADMPEDLPLHLLAGESQIAGGLVGDTGAAALGPPPVVHAHKATAQPLELAARPDVSALDRVHTPPEGAAAIPLTALAGTPIESSAGVSGPAVSGSSSEAGRGRVLTDREAGGLTQPEGTWRHSPSLLGGRKGASGYVESARSREAEGLGVAEGREIRREVREPRISEASTVSGVSASLASERPVDFRAPLAAETAIAETPSFASAGTTSTISSTAADIPTAGTRHTGYATGAGTGVGYSTDTGSRGRVLGSVAAPVSVLREDQSEMVCSSKEFSMVEDRPVLKERVERIVEHRPVEKEYVTEVRYTGEAPVAGGYAAEVVSTGTRVVDVAEPGPKCPAFTRTAAAPPAGVEAEEARGLPVSRVVDETRPVASFG